MANKYLDDLLAERAAIRLLTGRGYNVEKKPTEEEMADFYRFVLRANVSMAAGRTMTTKAVTNGEIAI